MPQTTKTQKKLLPTGIQISSITYYPYPSYIRQSDFEFFHKAYYLCGFLKKILAVCEEKQ